MQYMKRMSSLLCLMTPIIYTIEIPKGFGVPFNTSMAHAKRHNFVLTKNDPLWQKIRTMYNSYIEKDQDTSQLRIPKIVHRIWLGSPQPEACRKLGLTWRAHHPDWEIMLWTEKEIDAFGLQNRKLYDAAKNYGEKSDIARYEILERFGGLYVDTDFECLQPFDYLHYTCNFYAGLNCETNAEIFNGLIGSCPGHPILKLCIQRLKEPHRLANRNNDPMSILARTGPYFFTECIYAIMKDNSNNIVLFPTTYFYPWPYSDNNQKNPAIIAAWIRPESLALHRWHSAWI